MKQAPQKSASRRLAAFAIAVSVSLLGMQSGTVDAQTLAPRPPGIKNSLAQLESLPQSTRVVVKFKEGTAARVRSGRLFGLSASDTAGFASALAAFGLSQKAVRRLHARAEAELDAERSASQNASGRQLADLNLYYVIDLPPGVSAAKLADRLNRLGIVEFAEPGPVPAPPPVDILPQTPSFVPDQGYRNTPPQGVGALDPTQFPGADGRGLQVVDLEYSWQLNHEDLEIPSTRVILGGATNSDPFSNNDHGTAVLGEIVGKRNAYGVTGIASAAKAWVAPAFTSEFNYDPARAIGLATAQLGRGNVIIIEQQYWACGFTTGNSYGPVEWLQSVFDAISAATAKGIIVIEAAGNGSLNLDAPGCQSKSKRSFRNSGAIIVGAGSSANHSRLSFSSYGSRVDVQGWGEDVMTTGYGDAFNPGDARQLYTSQFSGTSSATPIVTGAVLSIQGVMKQCGVRLLGPEGMRRLLIRTGTPQGSGLAGHIGPLPRIKEALLGSAAAACVSAVP